MTRFQLSMVAVIVLFGAPSSRVDAAHPRPTRLLLACPVNQTLRSLDGNAVTATYAATVSGGRAPRVVTYSIPSGSAFLVGTTPVQVNASSDDGQSASCAFAVTVAYTPSVVIETYGPSSDITCPVGAVVVLPGAITIQQAVAANPTSTVFCLAGTYPIVGAITPKTGDTFVCTFGAIIDGTAWVTTDANQGAFRAHNQDIDDVTIRNCVIQHMPQRDIHFLGGTDRWTLEHNDIATAKTGINVGSGTGHIVRYNLIRNNTSGGYLSYLSVNPIFEHNEISYNGAVQKIVASTGAVFSSNFVHHNTGDGIWFDTENVNTTIEGNTVEDNTRFGIHVEINGSNATAIVIRTNSVKRSGDTGIMNVDSKGVEVSGNTLVDNFRGIQLYLKCAQVGGGSLDGYDLTNNNVHDNVVTLTASARSGSWTNTLGWPTSDLACTTLFVAPYLSNGKNNVYQGNTYTVPNVAAKYWMWGQGQFKTFSEWQLIPQDTTGSVH